MDINDLNRASVAGHAAYNIHELGESAKEIAKSKLSEEDKEIAIKEYKSMMKMLAIFPICVTVFMVLFIMIVMFTVSDPLNASIVAIGAAICIVFIITFSFVWKKKKMSNFDRCKKLVQYGWDGLTEEQIALLRPDKEDEKELRSKTVKEVIFWSLFILYCVAWFIFVRPVEIWVWFKIVILIAPLFFIYMQVDDVSTEKVRIKSGYYKRHLLNETKNETEIDEDEEIDLFN